MSIVKGILEGRRTAMNIGADLDTICLSRDDVKLLGSELLETDVYGWSVIQSMFLHGVISQPVKLFGINVTSKEKAPIYV